MSVIVAAGLLSVVCFVLCVRGIPAKSTRAYVLWSVLFVFVYITASDLRRIFPRIPRIPGQYNWTGELLAFLVCSVAVYLLTGFSGWNRRELGLTMEFNAGTEKDVLRFLAPILVVEFAVLWLLVPGQTLTFEDHLFQLTAPGLAEELAFRGILMGLLDRAFRDRRLILGAHLGWGAVVSSILFGLWHGLNVSTNLHVSLDVAPMAIPLVGGFVLAWCRARSGNLLLPFLAHAGMNEVANLIALAKPKP